MRVWTNGRTILSMNPAGLSMYADGRPVEHRAITAPSAAGTKRSAKTERHLVLAINEARGLALAGESESLLFLVDLKAKFPPRQLQLQVIDAAVANAAELLVALPPADKKDPSAVFALVEINKDGSTKNNATVEPIEPKRVKWPTKLGAASWAKQPQLSASGIRLTATDHGVTAADPGSGLVFVLRPDSEKFDFALQLPIEKALQLFALATAQGVLVAIPFPKGGALCHFAPDGRSLGYVGAPDNGWSPLGMPGLMGDAQAVCCYGNTLAEFRLPGLDKPVTSKLDIKAAAAVHLAGVDEQKLVAAADTQVWTLSRRTGADEEEEEPSDDEETSKGGEAPLWSVTPLPSAQDKNALLPPDAESIKGPPSLQVSQPAFGPRNWTAKSGSTALLPLLLANNGGEAEGVSIELSGEAVKKGLVKPGRVIAGSEKVEFKALAPDKFSAQLPGMKLEAAVEGPTEDAPPVSKGDAELQVELKAQTQGSALLMIRIIASDRQKRSSTAAFGRQFEVTGKK